MNTVIFITVYMLFLTTTTLVSANIAFKMLYKHHIQAIKNANSF